MASIEHLLISKIIEEQSLAETVNAGVKSVFFANDWENVYRWIVEYNSEHGAVPSERAFHTAYGDIPIEDASTETFSGLFKELTDAYRTRTIAATLSNVMGPLNNGDIDTAMGILSGGLQAASAEVNRLTDFNVIETWEERLARYDEIRKNPDKMVGIPTGFNKLDNLTRGFSPQQFIIMVGEPKRGKSLFELIMATACHRHGKVPLFISFEMTVDEQTARMDAMNAKVPISAMTDGTMTDAERERIRKAGILRQNMQRFEMSQDATGLTTVSAIGAKIREKKPDAVYVDGIYLMDDEYGEPKGSPQALTNISRSLKRLAQKENIPIIATTQVLGSKIHNKRTRTITADSIGYTSAFVQDADLVLGVERNPDLDDQAIIRIVEGRNVPHAEIHVKWDWRTMEFEEVYEVDEIDPSFD